MKDTLPLYRKLEKKIEALNEFVQVGIAFLHVQSCMCMLVHAQLMYSEDMLYHYTNYQTTSFCSCTCKCT